MEFMIAASALAAFSLVPASASLLLRCGLSACLRFSPRAALALSSVSALSACTIMLLCRGGLRAAVQERRGPVIYAALFGGTLGRMLLLMFTASFSGSLDLARIQAVPLLLIALAALFPSQFPLPGSRLGFFAFSVLCAFVDGFFGCGGSALFLLFGKRSIQRRKNFPQAAALLCSMTAHSFALLLTLLSGAAQVFPVRMLLGLSAGSALGGVIFEKTKTRSPLQKGLRIALYVYMILAALACLEHAFIKTGG